MNDVEIEKRDESKLQSEPTKEKIHQKRYGNYLSLSGAQKKKKK